MPADKNLGLCLVTVQWYHEMGLKLLENDSYIVDSPDFPTLSIALLRVIENSRDLLTRQQYAWLKLPCIGEEYWKIPVLKVIPKIHKAVPSGRPIVPMFDTLLANASSWVDYQIKPLLAKYPWILPDSKTFCREILDIKIPPGENIWLVSGDVVAMYPNIPVEDGITQIANKLGASAMGFASLEDAMRLKIRNRKELTMMMGFACPSWI